MLKDSRKISMKADIRDTLPPRRCSSLQVCGGSCCYGYQVVEYPSYSLSLDLAQWAPFLQLMVILLMLQITS